jgi:hypothetical protein
VGVAPERSYCPSHRSKRNAFAADKEIADFPTW